MEKEERDVERLYKLKRESFVEENEGEPLKIMQVYRMIPEELADVLPPHRIEFLPGDTNIGRACAICGFSVPAGCRYIHFDWCDAKHGRDKVNYE